MAHRNLVAAAILFFAPAGLAAGGNGGFEDGLSGWQVRNPSGTLTVTPDTKEKAEGAASAHLVKTGGMAGDGLVLPVPKVPAGGRLTVSARVKGKDLANAWLKLFVYDDAGQTVLDDCDVRMLRGTFEWTAMERTFALPKTAARAEVCLLLFLGGEAWLDDVRVSSPDGKPRKPLEKRVAKWLDENSVKPATLDFDAPLEDLEPFAKIVGDARIVQLGEPSHGDGATFRAKARLVRFLHERMGFEVLAFESGLFECDRANALLKAGKPDEAADASVFPIWRTAETKPLFAYMAKVAGSGKPLALAGFDLRGSGGLAAEFVARLVEFLKPAGEVSAEDATALSRLNELLAGDPYLPPEEARAAGLAAFTRVRALFDAGRAKLVAERGEAETEFFSRCLDNWGKREAFEKAKTDPSLGAWGAGNLRDGRMAENLKWLSEVRFPGKRIVTWAATMHQARGLDGISIGGNARFYAGCEGMGEAVAAAFGPAVVTVGFLAHHGVAGTFAPKWQLEAPKDDSFEDVFWRYGPPLLLVDLRRGGPLDSTRFASPMSYDRTIKARWSQVLDVFFYTEEQTSSTR